MPGEWITDRQCRRYMERRRSGDSQAVLAGQCLDRRIEDKAMLVGEAAAWNAERNARHAKVNWRLPSAGRT